MNVPVVAEPVNLKFVSQNLVQVDPGLYERGKVPQFDSFVQSYDKMDYAVVLPSPARLRDGGGTSLRDLETSYARYIKFQTASPGGTKLLETHTLMDFEDYCAYAQWVIGPTSRVNVSPLPLPAQGSAIETASTLIRERFWYAIICQERGIPYGSIPFGYEITTEINKRLGAEFSPNDPRVRLIKVWN